MSYSQRNIISDIDLYAKLTDPNLINPWGLLNDTDGSLWVAANGSGNLLHYDKKYNPVQPIVPIPISGGGTGTGSPSGIVFNKTKGFEIAGSFIGPAKIIIVTEDGVIAGYNKKIDHRNVVVKITTPNAVYKGVTLADDCLFVANFNSGFIEKYDSDWNLLTKFTDPSLTATGYSPFNVYANGHYIYCAFAKQDMVKHDDVSGIGNGYIDVFSFQGKLIKRLINRGSLNSPWGLFVDGDKLYVSNFGDGKINVFIRRNGELIAPLLDPNGNPISIDGIWSIIPIQNQCEKKTKHKCERHKHKCKCHDNNDTNDDDVVMKNNSIYVTAGINSEDNGLLAILNSSH